jgi:uncharacterized C2H2 Zn-finger protein
MSRSYECNICGMILANSEELTKHQTIVHINKMLQCQSCGRVFDNKDKFNRHVAKVHGNSHQLDSNFGKKYRFKEQIDDIESMLLKQITEEEKARKRTRGPYRKSSSVTA